MVDFKYCSDATNMRTTYCQPILVVLYLKKIIKLAICTHICRISRWHLGNKYGIVPAKSHLYHAQTKGFRLHYYHCARGNFQSLVKHSLCTWRMNFVSRAHRQQFDGVLTTGKTKTRLACTLTSTKRSPDDPADRLHPILHVILGAGHKKIGLMVGCHAISVSPCSNTRERNIGD